MKKRLISKTYLLILILIILSGCVSKPTSEPTASATATINPTATSTPQPTHTATPSPTPTPLPMNGQQSHYEINATINYYNRFITAKSTVTYTNKVDVPLNELVFIIYPTIFGNAIYIRSVTLGDGTAVTNYTWESHRMIIPLESPLMPNETIKVTHDYELYMPDRDGVFGQTGRQLTLSYWFPTIPPYDENEGWMAYELSLVNSFYVGENQSFESSDFDVTLQFTDRRENLTIAAGALPEEADGMIHFHSKLSRTFSLVISDVYTVTERQVEGTLIKVYTFPENPSVAAAAADLAEQSLLLYQELYGPYERDVLSIIEVDLGINMEFDGMALIMSSFFWHYNNTPKTDLTIIIPHEITHQWFFSLVGNNQAMQPWLDEAFATYSEALFYERYYPEELEWYWNTRVYDHLPYGYIDETIYLEGGVPEYFNKVYRVGAWFLQDLREAIGDEAFFGFLHGYIQENRYQIADEEDFVRALREYTDADLTALWQEYFITSPE